MIFLFRFMVTRTTRGRVMHNLGTVIKFEIRRTLKKKTFWISALAIPMVAALVGVMMYFSNTTTNEMGKQLASERYSLGVTDNAATLTPDVIQSLHAKKLPSKQEGIKAVKDGKLDAYFYYPTDMSKQPVEVYGKEVGIFKNGRYESLAQQLLLQSTLQTTNPTARTILQGKVEYKTTTYKNGQIDKGILKLIIPGLFLVLFYFMIVTFGSQMLTSIIEEKENRVIEMILTTIKPASLLLGKLFSLIILAFIQLMIILLPIVAGYLLFKSQLSLPNFELSNIPIDPMAIILGAAIFTTSFLMYTGILMTLGAAMPTAKEANNFFGV